MVLDMVKAVVEAWPVIARLVPVALVKFKLVKVPAAGVEPPMTVLSMLPPDMVRLSATSESAQSKDKVPELASLVLLIELSAKDEPSTLPDGKTACPDTYKLVVVAEVEVILVNTPVLGVVAPIEALSMVPPDIVGLFKVAVPMVGLVPKTRAPEPVSSVTMPANSAEVSISVSNTTLVSR